MQRKRDGLVPVAEALADLPGVQAIRPSPPARRGFTRFDQVDQLIEAREADPDLGFMARTMALCSLPPKQTPATGKSISASTDPSRSTWSRAAVTSSLMATCLASYWPGSVPKRYRPEAACWSWVVRWPSFMRSLGVYNSSAGRGGVRTRLRNQMDRLFHTTVQLIYEDERGKATVSSLIADSTAFWWNEHKPNESSLWESKIELSEKFFNEIVSHPVPFNMNTLNALKRSPLGLDLYLWLVYRTFCPPRSQTAHLAAPVLPVRSAPGQGNRQSYRPQLPT